MPAGKQGFQIGAANSNWAGGWTKDPAQKAEIGQFADDAELLKQAIKYLENAS